MGYFTWTYANRKLPEQLDGWKGYPGRCKLPYGGRGVIICPDDSLIIENNYEGYGIFAGNDAYDLVTDWNKAHLTDIFSDLKQIAGDEYWGYKLYDVAKAFQENDEENLAYCRKRLHDSGELHMSEDWKRLIGITIACEDEIHSRIPYPIKIVGCKTRFPKYASLPYSHSCQ